MFKFVEPDRRILFMDIPNQTVIGFSDFCGESDRTFDISVEELATNKELLETLHLISLYADGKKGGIEHAIEFFKFYIASFYNDEGVKDKLDTNPTLRILVQDKVKLEKVRKIFA